MKHSMEKSDPIDIDKALGCPNVICIENYKIVTSETSSYYDLPCQESDEAVCDSWTDSPAIKPPPEFQDASPLRVTPRMSPLVTPARIRSLKLDSTPQVFLNPIVPRWVEKLASKVVSQALKEALQVSGNLSWSILCSESCHSRLHPTDGRRDRFSLINNCLPPPGPRLCWTPELPYSLCRPASRSSLSSRLSSSHNSLSVPAANRADDSSFITSAMSHEVLSTADVSDMYNVPVDCDVYAVPIDTVRAPQPLPLPPQRPKRQRHPRRKRKHNPELGPCKERTVSSQTMNRPQFLLCEQVASRKHNNRPGRSSSVECTTSGEPIHMTLQEVRRYLSSLYSSSSDSSDYCKKHSNSIQSRSHSHVPKTDAVAPFGTIGSDSLCTNNNAVSKSNRKSTFTINMRNKKSKSENLSTSMGSDCTLIPDSKPKRGISFSSALKQTFCNMFRFRKLVSTEQREIVVNLQESMESLGNGEHTTDSPSSRLRFSKRALPPLPAREGGLNSQTDDPLALEETSIFPENEAEPSADFASSIEKVKDYGWYWGPISGEAAEKILSNEPDGSFIVRDSSDDHYIFSLTFKLNNCVRHVRIEQDQGTFSFGSCTKFKSHTIVEFIENAVEHSRSGRYLFFLHRRPVLGPMRVQLLHPVSRFKQVQSLQHMCRFVILKGVRRDLISSLPLPRRLIDYLSTHHYYSENLSEEELTAAPPSPSLGDQGLFPFMPPGFS